MSAILGLVHFNQEPVSPFQSSEFMTRLLPFPADVTQTWHDHNVFLGCHAQWITPESIEERLPYHDEERELVITSDSILDNREELFEKLQIKASDQPLITDSKLILLAYAKWGENSPKHLLGDFAYIIWDIKKKKIFGARDMLGCRTLYYYKDLNRFAFCTLIEPLFSLDYIQREWNKEWLAEFLALSRMYESTDVHATLYKDIRQIPPAHSMTVTTEGLQLKRYGRLADTEPLRLKDPRDYEEAFRDVFGEAVRARTRTYKNVASHLSGGLDSGSVASFASKHLRTEGKSLYTYSYIPPEDFVDWTPKRSFADERPYIRSTVNHVGNIKDHYLDFKGKSPYSEVDVWLDLLEMPYKYFEATFWTRGCYEHAQADGAGILLTGSRGNYTISWGPALDYYVQLLKKGKWHQLQKEIKHFSEIKGIGRKRILSILLNRAAESFNWKKQSGEELSIISPELAKQTNIYEKISQRNSFALNGPKDSIEARMYQMESLEIPSKNGNLATKLSLAYGVWERDPTCDPRVVRFCLSVPFEEYVQNGVDRALIRRATKGYLPDKVRLNHTSRGIQASDWIHRTAPHWESFLNELNHMVKDPEAAEYISIPFIQTVLSKLDKNPPVEEAFNKEIRFAMRSLIFYRFLKRSSKGGDTYEKDLERAYS
ncbi:asparagine synthase-related protein [Bacillus gobiensis]|uniref:asparagine synthase-related protein n=1 Tax=Bacillus gobiensis TaxID=1441095 RepID=UPI003D221417